MTAAKPREHPTKVECVDCAKLPENPSPGAMTILVVEYRPKTPRKIDPRSTDTHKASPRCTTHWRAWKNTSRLRSRTGHKAKTYGVPRELQVELWVFQGSSCPCGRKRSQRPQEIPPGVTLDHEHGAPCIVAGVHDEKHGCLECVTGFVCSHCNQEVLGRLEGAFRRDPLPRQRVAFALLALAAHVTDPPLRRLLAERPELKAISA
jgi:hypothetical protein